MCSSCEAHRDEDAGVRRGGGAVEEEPLELFNYFTELCSGSEAGSYLRLIELTGTRTRGCDAGVARSRSNASNSGSDAYLRVCVCLCECECE